MDKNERKKIVKELKEQKKTEFEKSLPMTRNLFRQLFDFLDKKLADDGCSNTLSLTTKFLKQNNIACETVLDWLRKNGGYCDCEVLANVEEKFEDDAIL